MRIAAISDQHGFLPDIPPCDLLIVAGDVCPDAIDRQFAANAPELQKMWFDREIRRWLAASPAKHKVLTWGNHDWCGEQCNFAADAPRRADSTILQILVDCATGIPRGEPGNMLKVWASPWSKQFGEWAFMRPDQELAAVYSAIPAGIDVLVSHQPPYGYCDAVPDFHTGRPRKEGSRALLAAIDRVKPRVVICGHIHEGHGSATRNETAIYNVSVVDEHYRLVHSATEFDL